MIRLPLYDSHAHLDDPDATGERVASGRRRAGLVGALTAGYGPER